MKMKRLFVIGLLCLFSTFSITFAHFFTLSQAESYAKVLPKSVMPDNKNWQHPVFDSFHRKQRPNFFSRLSMRFGLGKKLFDIGVFKDVLEQMVGEREKKKRDTPFGQQFKPIANDTFLIWTDLFGAFHSFLRDLAYLKERNIIDDSFKIIKPNYYVVFNGNVVGGSPFILETFFVVLLLMKKNPNHVFYTCGSHEIEERWQNFELIRELKMRGEGFSKELIPFASLFNRFFKSLPLALFLTQDEKDRLETVLIGNNDKIKNYLTANNLSQLLNTKDQHSTFLLSKKRSSNATSDENKKTVQLQAYITGEDRAINFHVTTGLSLIGSFEGATKWLVFSSPTERNQILYNFHYDAFAEIKIAKRINSWTIALINQDIKKLEGFQEAALYNLITGREIFVSGERKKSTVINFGSTMDLSKGASPIGKKVKEGLELAFDRELVTDSIANLIPQIRTIDDEYTPHKTRGAVEELMKDGTTFLIGSQGSASLESYLDMIQRGDVLVLFPFTGSPLFRNQNLKNILHYRGSYIREGEELINYALKDLKSKKIALFYQDDAFGRGALEGARRTLKEEGMTSFIEVPHERNVVDYKSQAEKIKEANPDTILFFTNALAIRGLIRQLGVQYFAGKKLLGLSVYEDAFERFLKDKGLEFVLIRMVPDPATSTLQIAKEYREWADRKNLSYDKVAFEQYINASILFLILSKIKGPITKEAIIKVGESFNNYSFKGLNLNLNPETRELSETLWIDPGQGAWIARYAKSVPRKTAIEKEELVENDNVLRLGSTIDLSLGAKVQGKAVQAGLEIRLKQAQVEMLKKIPTISIIDDAYTPSETKKDVKKFLSEGISTLICPVGSPTLESYLDLVKEGSVSVFFPITGAPMFREENLSHLIHLRASYATEGRVLTEYALDTLETKKLALFYQEDSFGRGLLDASVELLKERKISDYIAVPYKRNKMDFSEQVARISEFKPEAILFFTTSIAGRSFIRQYGIQNIKSLKLIGNSDFGEERVIKFMKDTGLSFTYVNVMPNPLTSTLEIVKQFNEACKTYNVTPDIFSLEAYVSMDLFLTTMQSIEKPVTREKIMSELIAIKGEDYKGLYLQFDPKTRTLLHTLWFNEGAPEWKKIDLLKSGKTH